MAKFIQIPVLGMIKSINIDNIIDVTVKSYYSRANQAYTNELIFYITTIKDKLDFVVDRNSDQCREFLKLFNLELYRDML